MRLLALLILPLALLCGSAAAQPEQPAASPGEALFVISGRGYGHGVGMGQYGAYGMANAGHTHEEILAHYYAGAELGRTGRKDVRVLLLEGRQAVTVSSTVPFSALDGAGVVHKLPAGPLVLRSNLSLATLAGPAKAVAPLVVRPGKAPLSLDGRQFRGKLEVAPQGRFGLRRIA